MTEKIINNIKIFHHDCVDSTNKIALNMEKYQHLDTVVSDCQTAGRGRIGREFFSYNGGLYMSVILDPIKINIPLHLCTPSAALAVKKALASRGIENIFVKWVNDLYMNRKKICGILSESRTVDSKIDRVVIGIGINLKMHKDGFPNDIANKAGYADYDGDKLTLASDITKNICEYLSKTQDEIISEYTDNMAWIGEKVTVTDYADSNKQIEGVILGVNSDCYLKIRTEDGCERLLFSGEIL